MMFVIDCTYISASGFSVYTQHTRHLHKIPFFSNECMTFVIIFTGTMVIGASLTVINVIGS